MFLDDVLTKTGAVPETPSCLGPSSTANLTYKDAATYSGLVTFTWDAQCRYTDEIKFSENTYGPHQWLFNFSFPGLSINYTNMSAWGSTVFTMRPTDGYSNTTYFAVLGADEQTVNLEAATARSAISRANGAWISRVACTPIFNWHTSTCTWSERSGAMQDCVDEPWSNTTELDTKGLDDLAAVLPSIPGKIASNDIVTYGLQPLQAVLMLSSNATGSYQYRAPVLADYVNMFGLAARATASIATSGYYGTAVVHTEESVSRPAYIVREYVLAAVLVILTIPSILCMAAMGWARASGVPMRPATFLTVAAATRGPWWDGTLFGDCVRPHRQLLAKHRDSGVMFGVDGNTAHVGFTPNAGPVTKDTLYA